MSKPIEKTFHIWCDQIEYQDKNISIQRYNDWIDVTLILLNQSDLRFSQLKLLKQFVETFKLKNNSNRLNAMSHEDLKGIWSLAFYAEQVLSYQTDIGNFPSLQWDGKIRFQNSKDYFINIHQLGMWASNFIADKNWGELKSIITEILVYAQNHMVEAEFQFTLETARQKLGLIKSSMNGLGTFTLFENKIKNAERLIGALSQLSMQTIPDKNKVTLIKLLESVIKIMEYGSLVSNSDCNFDEHINQIKLLVFQLEKLGLGRPDRTWLQPIASAVIGLAVVGLVIGIMMLTSALGFAPAVAISSYFGIKAGTTSIIMNGVVLGGSVALGIFGLYGVLGYAKGHGIAKCVNELAQSEAQTLFEPDQTF